MHFTAYAWPDVLLASDTEATKLISSFPTDVTLVLIITLGEGWMLNLASDERLFFRLEYAENSRGSVVLRRDRNTDARDGAFHWYGYVWGRKYRAFHVDLRDHSILPDAASVKGRYLSRDFISNLAEVLGVPQSALAFKHIFLTGGRRDAYHACASKPRPAGTLQDFLEDRLLPRVEILGRRYRAACGDQTILTYSGTGCRSAFQVIGDDDRHRVASGRSSARILTDVMPLSELTVDDLGGVVRALMEELDAKLISFAFQFQTKYRVKRGVWSKDVDSAMEATLFLPFTPDTHSCFGNEDAPSPFSLELLAIEVSCVVQRSIGFTDLGKSVEFLGFVIPPVFEGCPPVLNYII